MGDTRRSHERRIRSADRGVSSASSPLGPLRATPGQSATRPNVRTDCVAKSLRLVRRRTRLIDERTHPLEEEVSDCLGRVPDVDARHLTVGFPRDRHNQSRRRVRNHAKPRVPQFELFSRSDHPLDEHPRIMSDPARRITGARSRPRLGPPPATGLESASACSPRLACEVGGSCTRDVFHEFNAAGAQLWLWSRGATEDWNRGQARSMSRV